MAATPSLRVVKSMDFKGGTRTFSNRYHFSGGTPADATHWHTLMDAVTAAEKAIFHSDISITLAVGYAAGSDVPVAEKSYTLAGTYTLGGSDEYTPGEVAALARWSTDGTSTKNHPIYCFSYWHGALVGGAPTTRDVLASGQRTAMQTYATSWLTGFSDGTITAKRASPAGHLGTGSLIEEYVTHRDFPSTTSV